MPKKSDTQALAIKTADQLLMEGVRPTQQNVRERMGSGSITTINKALTAWWSELGQRLKTNTSHPMLPDPVAESANKLWLQALAYAERQYVDRTEALERDYRIKVKDLEKLSSEDGQELKELRAQCLRLLQENERINDAKNSQQSRIFELETELIALQAKYDGIERELKQAKVVSKGSQDLDEYIELQVVNRTLKEENKRLNKQLDALVNEKSSMQLAIARLEQENHLLKERQGG